MDLFLMWETASFVPTAQLVPGQRVITEGIGQIQIGMKTRTAKTPLRVITRIVIKLHPTRRKLALRT